jgi:hypothetical protein
MRANAFVTATLHDWSHQVDMYEECYRRAVESRNGSKGFRLANLRRGIPAPGEGGPTDTELLK